MTEATQPKKRQPRSIGFPVDLLEALKQQLRQDNAEQGVDTSFNQLILNLCQEYLDSKKS